MSFGGNEFHFGDGEFMKHVEHLSRYLGGSWNTINLRREVQMGSLDLWVIILQMLIEVIDIDKITRRFYRIRKRERLELNPWRVFPFQWWHLMNAIVWIHIALTSLNLHLKSMNKLAKHIQKEIITANLDTGHFGSKI